ncbi:hypothetical protein GEMRC1_007024 [Eukaryota sp. GEM-RC1]
MLDSCVSPTSTASGITEGTKKPVNDISIQQSLLILIHLHLLKRRFQYSVYAVDVDGEELHQHVLNLKQDLAHHFQTIGYISNLFFDTAVLAVRLFSKQPPSLLLPQILLTYIHLPLSLEQRFNVEEYISSSDIISSLDLVLQHGKDLEFLNCKSSQFFSNLRHLHVSVDAPVLMPFVELLKLNTSVTSVLKVNTTIATVNLSYNFIRNECARSVAEVLKVNTTVTSIDLRGNSIGNDGVTTLSNALLVNSTLTNINLRENSIGKVGVIALADALKVNSTLTSVDLGKTSIGNDGAKALADALKVNVTLRSVNLEDNFITAEGARALAEALTINNSLTTINLSRNCLGIEGYMALDEVQKNKGIVIILVSEC